MARRAQRHRGPAALCTELRLHGVRRARGGGRPGGPAGGAGGPGAGRGRDGPARPQPAAGGRTQRLGLPDAGRRGAGAAARSGPGRRHAAVAGAAAGRDGSGGDALGPDDDAAGPAQGRQPGALRATTRAGGFHERGGRPDRGLAAATAAGPAGRGLGVAGAALAGGVARPRAAGGRRHGAAGGDAGLALAATAGAAARAGTRGHGGGAVAGPRAGGLAGHRPASHRAHRGPAAAAGHAGAAGGRWRRARPRTPG